jgi:tRNA(fMet)-specific endonuclease VapC
VPYLLDSDVLIYYINGVESIQELFKRIAPDGLAVSAVSYMETRQGLGRSQYPREAQIRLDDLLETLPIIAFSRPEAYRCANLRETLLQKGQRVRQRALDLMIAATALEYELTLLTNNPADYKDLPGLRIETPQTL